MIMLDTWVVAIIIFFSLLLISVWLWYRRSMNKIMKSITEAVEAAPTDDGSQIKGLSYGRYLRLKTDSPGMGVSYGMALTLIVHLNRLCRSHAYHLIKEKAIPILIDRDRMYMELIRREYEERGRVTPDWFVHAIGTGARSVLRRNR